MRQSVALAFMERVLVEESVLNDPRVERLRHETAVTHLHAQLCSCGVSERCSPLPTTTIAHISVIQFIVPFVRAITATHSHSSLNHEPRKAIVCCLCIVIVVGALFSVSLLCCGGDENLQKFTFCMLGALW